VAISKHWSLTPSRFNKNWPWSHNISPWFYNHELVPKFGLFGIQMQNDQCYYWDSWSISSKLFHECFPKRKLKLKKLKIIEGFLKTSFVIFPKSIQLLASSQWQKGPRLVQLWLKSSWHLLEGSIKGRIMRK
jgi:hypothetical protein